MYGPKHCKIVHFNGEVPSGSGYRLLGERSGAHSREGEEVTLIAGGRP